ncbi:MAG: homocysteine S-methyltransferase family protein, partial [Eggerthellaceae bacterium]|nr:homocysteine S-methyltransferase family protein [Eggerthellaceae bacterium]
MAADLNSLRIKDEYLREVLEGRRFLLFDGAFGTMMQRAGLTLAGENPDLLNLTNPQAITAIHRAYVEAGAQVATTNTFGANVRKLEGAATVAEVYKAAADAARASGARYVAGDIGPTGALLEPMGTLPFEEAYAIFAEQARAAQDAGCDLIVVETMSDLREAKAAVLAARAETDLPIFATMTFGEDGRTFLGTTPAIAAMTLSSLDVSAVGMNCSLGPDELASLVEEMAPYLRCPLMVQPNAGLPRVEDGQTVYDVTPAEFAVSMEHILNAGAVVVGGCCGTDPSFIEALAELLADRDPVAPAHCEAFC